MNESDARKSVTTVTNTQIDDFRPGAVDAYMAEQREQRCPTCHAPLGDHGTQDLIRCGQATPFVALLQQMIDSPNQDERGIAWHLRGAIENLPHAEQPQAADTHLKTMRDAIEALLQSLKDA